MTLLEDILHARQDATVTRRDHKQLHAEFRTRVFRFIDDAVFVVDEQTKTLHFRAAARLGLYDFGNNRRRMRRIRRTLVSALRESDRVTKGKHAFG